MYFQTFQMLSYVKSVDIYIELNNFKKNNFYFLIQNYLIDDV